MVPDKVDLIEKFSKFNERWSPKIVGEVNDAYVKIAKIEGEFTWHHHAHEDEMFMVIRGTLIMQFRERNVVLQPGEVLIVPRGVEHCPKAESECHIMMIEPKTTLNTGNVQNERTVAELERV
jgi:mannose-6-phosphate isomerase-like protein (cupin superfamily)